MKFQDLVGQTETVAHLRSLIQQGRLPHALMLRGPAGVGKLALARALAQYINCQNPTETDSCGKCPNCLKISKGIHPDLRFVLPIISKSENNKPVLSENYLEEFREMVLESPYAGLNNWQEVLGASNRQLMIGVEEIRKLKRDLSLKAFEAPYKIALIWNAEFINVQGANAFLKLLEEPPDRTLLLMTCSDPSRLLGTIRSRCQQVALGRIPAPMIQSYLTDKKEVPAEKAKELAGISEGSVGNALDFMAESTHALNQLYMNWLRVVFQGRYNRIQLEIEKIYTESKEFQKLFLQFALKKIRDSLLYNLDLQQLALVTQNEREFHQKFSAFANPERVALISLELEESLRQITGNGNPQMVLTALSLRMHHIFHQP
ncbi:MAG: DNA polymerase III subunit delta' [Bacteroidota bacterium]